MIAGQTKAFICRNEPPQVQRQKMLEPRIPAATTGPRAMHFTQIERGCGGVPPEVFVRAHGTAFAGSALGSVAI